MQKWGEIEGEQQHFHNFLAEQEQLATSNSFHALQNMGSGEDITPDYELAAGDIMDMVTGVSDTSLQQSQVSNDLATKLLTTARECAMNRQLRSARDGMTMAALNGTLAAISTDSVVDVAPSAATDTPKLDKTTSKRMPSEEVEEIATPSNANDSTDAIQDTATGAVQIGSEAVCSTAAGVDVVQTDMTCPVPDERAANIETTSPPPAQVKYITKRKKNKKQNTEFLPKRLLRSSTKKYSNSEITPEMIEVFARNQCSYVPGDYLGQPKAKQVVEQTKTKPTNEAFSSNHKHLEEMLKRQMDMGKTPAAYMIDPGDTNPLQMMDFITRQQWSSVAGSVTSDDYISE